MAFHNFLHNLVYGRHSQAADFIAKKVLIWYSFINNYVKRYEVDKRDFIKMANMKNISMGRVERTMKEQKFLRNLSLLIAIVTLIMAIIVEIFPSEYVTISYLKGHRNFGVSLFLGIFSGAIFSFFITWMQYCIQKAKTVNCLINDLVSIKRCIYEIENNIDSMPSKTQELCEVCYKILSNPENWDLEGEIILEKDFIGAIKDIRESCMSEAWFRDKKFLVGEYIDRFVLNILKQCHIQSKQFSDLLKYYDIK